MNLYEEKNKCSARMSRISQKTYNRGKKGGKKNLKNELRLRPSLDGEKKPRGTGNHGGSEKI